uniref:Uncharacterized protein n=1 Tax=viral metagenome TaxID=1070528 RepID=A0A6C0KF52_9ZZZZ
MSTEQIIVNDVAIQTSVAPIEVPPVEVAVKQTKEKKPKKVSDSPKLAPRFQKFIDFGYWVALQLKNKNLINDEVFQTILTDIKMNDEVGVQTEFYTNYEKSGKSGKPTVSPDAPSLTADGDEVKPKAKKSGKPTGRDSTPDAPSLTADGDEVKPKAKKARKPKVVATEAGLVEGVAEGVSVEKPKAAKKSRKPTGRDSTPDAPSLPVEGSEVVPVEGVPVEEKPKAKKARKPKASSDATQTVPVEGSETGVVEAVPVEGVPVEEKPKAKKTRKPKASSDATQTVPVEGVENKSTKKSRKSKAPDDIIHQLLSSSNKTTEPIVEVVSENKVNTNADNEVDEDTVDISVSSIIINNVEYLIDDEFNLYDTKTNENIGTFINEQLQLNA